MMNIIELFLIHGYIVKFWPHNLAYDAKYANPLEQKGVQIFHGPTAAGGLSALLSESSDAFDLFLLSRPAVATDLLPIIRAHRETPIIYYGHDIHHLRLRAQLGVLGPDAALSEEAKQVEEQEKAIWPLVDLILYPSVDEEKYVQLYNEGQGIKTPVRSIPVTFERNFPSTEDISPDNRKDILFVAGFGHPPNVDAALWFASEVFPLVLLHHPTTKLILVGSNPRPEVVALAGENIVVTGRVPQERLDFLYRSSRLAVAPLRFGAGMKGKVVEAMCRGLPVVTTSVGAQGLSGAIDALCIADAPHLMAEGIANLLHDDARWQCQAEKALDFAQMHFSAEAMWAPFGEAVKGFRINRSDRGSTHHL